MIRTSKRSRLPVKRLFPVCWRDTGVAAGIFALAVGVCAALRLIDKSDVYVALIFELAVVLVSRFTNGYLYGLLASLGGVVCVNYIFTYPYFEFNFTISGYPLTFLVMILVPVAITLLIAAACVGVIWFRIAHGTGLGFEDSESFYQASAAISDLAADALSAQRQNERTESLKTLSSFLDRGAMSLVVTADGAEIYRYGSGQNTRLDAAALALGGEGTVSAGADSLHIRPVTERGVRYEIFLYGTQRELSYASLKTAVVIAGGVLLLTILLSVFFTDRFLTRFVVRHAVEQRDVGDLVQIGGSQNFDRQTGGYSLHQRGKAHKTHLPFRIVHGAQIVKPFSCRRHAGGGQLQKGQMAPAREAHDAAFRLRVQTGADDGARRAGLERAFDPQGDFPLPHGRHGVVVQHLHPDAGQNFQLVVGELRDGVRVFHDYNLVVT